MNRHCHLIKSFIIISSKSVLSNPNPTHALSKTLILSTLFNGGSSNPFFSTKPHQTSILPEDYRKLLREEAVPLLSNLWLESFKNPNQVVTNLSAHLRRLELWVLGYQKVCAEETGSYLPRDSIEKPVIDGLISLRDAVMAGRFKWGSRLEFFVRSPRDKRELHSLSRRKFQKIMTAPYSTPFQDQIVHEVLLMVLEPVYESRFSQKSYAFRPGRHAHTAIRMIRRNFAGYIWYVKCDLSTILRGINPNLVINALLRDVRDRLIVDLIKSALITPVITGIIPEEKKKIKRKNQKKKVLPEDEPKPDPYWLLSFFGFAPEEAEKTPNWGHCAILSPLLANIVFDELDHWMEEKIAAFSRESNNNPDLETAQQANNSWPEFVPTTGPDKMRRMDYIRYGGHVLIGIRGLKADAFLIRKQLIEFCDHKFDLKLDNETTPIEHITKGIMFLDHVLCRRVVYPTLRYTASGGKIVSEKGVGTLLSVTASLKQCIRQFRKLDFLKGDREPDPQPCFRMFHATQAHTNAQMNKFLFTMGEWYRYADNRKKVVNFCSYIIRGSLAKLYAAKYKLKSRAKVYKIASRNLSRPLKEKKGLSSEYHNLMRMGLLDSVDGLLYTRLSLVPDPDYTPFPLDWRPDHERMIFEHLKLEDPNTLREQMGRIREEGIVAPQDYVCKLVWDYKKSAKLYPETKTILEELDRKGRELSSVSGRDEEEIPCVAKMG